MEQVLYFHNEYIGTSYKQEVDKNLYQTIDLAHNQHSATINFNNTIIDKIKKTIINLSSRHKIKEDMYIIAIKNLIKKNNYLQLSLQLSEDIITEDEFEKEVTTNSGKYVIKIDNKDITFIHLDVIQTILKDVDNKGMTLHDVSEMFSIDTHSFEPEVNYLT